MGTCATLLAEAVPVAHAHAGKRVGATELTLPDSYTLFPMIEVIINYSKGAHTDLVLQIL